MPEGSPILPEQLPISTGVRIIAANEDGLVALDKPVGTRSHPNRRGERKRSLLRARYNLDEEFYFWTDADGIERRAWLVNRLDSPTSGIILLALDEELSTLIKAQFASHRVTKIYYALVKKVPAIPSGAWNDKLSRNVYMGKNLVKGGKTISAKTRYATVKSPTGGFPMALLRLTPVTGRTHQLRVQCKKHDHPIVGDKTYGSFSFNREVSSLTGEKRMMLHSAATSVNYAFKGKVRLFEAESPLPEAFSAVLRFRPGVNVVNPAAVKEKTSSRLSERRFKV